MIYLLVNNDARLILRKKLNGATTRQQQYQPCIIVYQSFYFWLIRSFTDPTYKQAAFSFAVLCIIMFFYDLLKDNGKFSKPMISSKTTTKILYGNLKKRFFESEKMASGKIFRHFLHANFFMFILLLSNHTVFFVQFEINLHL